MPTIEETVNARADCETRPPCAACRGELTPDFTCRQCGAGASTTLNAAAADRMSTPETRAAAMLDAIE